jgi:hypothetical protein
MPNNYSNQRTSERRSGDRRSNERRSDMEIYDNSSDGVVGLLLDKINNQSSDAHKGEQLTFTIPQILTGLIAFVTIGGSLLAAWINLTNQITTQKVSTELTITQVQKELTSQQTINKEVNTKIENIVVQIQGSIDKLSNRVEDLDNTVGQLYNRTIIPKK